MMLWSLEDEIRLFHAMMYFKPVGYDRNFQMICLANRFNSIGKPEFQISELWRHLDELYKLDDLVSLDL